MEKVSNRKRSLPTRFVRIGETIERYGVPLVCVQRPPGLHPADACKGCFFSKARMGEKVMNCLDIQCSGFDRMDRSNVWFVKQSDYGEV